MDDETTIIRELAKLAREEPVPRVDVTADVMRAIRSEEPRVSPIFVAAAAISAAAAAVIAVFAVQAWSVWQDPVAQLFASVVEVMP